MPTLSSLPPHYQPQATTLVDHVVLVTGAGQGLGRAAAIAAAAAGATVILHGRNVAKLEAVYDDIVAASGPTPAILPLDYLKAEQVDLTQFAEAIHQAFGKLDGIFHAASHMSPLKPLAETPLAAWRVHLAVNVAIPAAMTSALLPLLNKSGRGSVVFLTETHALNPTAFWGAFATAKSALTALTTMLAAENSKVRFNCCLPGPVASPCRAQSHPAEAAATLPAPQALAPHFIYLLSTDSAPLCDALHTCA